MEEDTMYADISDLDLFFGSTSTYEEFKKKHNIVEPEREKEEKPEEKEEENHAGPKIRLSLDNLREVTEEELTILRRTRCAHDYDEVFMQSSLEFYDTYYNRHQPPRSKNTKLPHYTLFIICANIAIYSGFIDLIVLKVDKLKF